MKETDNTARGASTLPLTAAIGLAAVVITRSGWLCDDAYITFRTVENLMHGLGPVWNPGERVQAFTHPLWLFLAAAGRLITGETYASAITLGVICSLLALGILGMRCARTPLAGALAVLVLTNSRAFVDYATSGLENPLSNLLLTAFAALLLRDARGARDFGDFRDARNAGADGRLTILALLASLGLLTRPDLALLFLPGLLVAAHPLRWQRAVRSLALGALPFVAWEAFSLVYYGFPFPNTAYAKLGSGVESAELWARGASYLLSSWTHDPTTPAAILAGIAVALWRGDRWSRSLAAGAALYLVFVAAIGGDFMRGRFLAAPLLVAMIALARDRAAVTRLAPVAATLLVSLSFLAPNVPALTGASFGGDRTADCDEHGICDERRFYYRATGLLRRRPGVPVPDSPYAELGRHYRLDGTTRTIVHRYIGFLGYSSGPNVHVIDEHALADPLLARLPAVWSPQWRVGHFRRLVPPGYAETVSSGSNRLLDPDLARYYDELARITRGRLFDPRRWESIAKMNLGLYDRLVDHDRYRFPGLARLTLAEAAAPVPAEIPTESSDLSGLPTLGVRVDLGALQRAPVVTVTLGGGEHLVAFLRGGHVAASTRTVVAGDERDATPGATTIPVPGAASRRGYDTLLIVPVRKSTPLGVSGLRLG